MHNFISSFGWVNYCNQIVLKYRVFRRAKRIGVNNLSPLAEELSKMISRMFFWLSFLVIGSISLALVINSLGEQVNFYSAVVLAGEGILFAFLWFFSSSVIKPIVRQILLKRTEFS